MLALPLWSAPVSDSSTVLKLKAAFVYNFTKFVKWPDAAFVSANAPLNVCAVGDEELEGALSETMRDKKADSHPIKVVRLHGAADAAKCQILYVQGQDLAKASNWLENFAQPGLLTISEISDLSDQRAHVAMITFVPDSNRIRFAISEKLAEKGRMEISSKLLSLAVSVEK